MAFLAVDKDGEEWVFDLMPQRGSEFGRELWCCDGGNGVQLPNGSIASLIGHYLTWDDSPVQFLKSHHFKEKEVYSDIFQDGGWKVYQIEQVKFQVVCIPQFGGEEKKVLPLFDSLEEAKNFAAAKFT